MRRAGPRRARRVSAARPSSLVGASRFRRRSGLVAASPGDRPLRDRAPRRRRLLLDGDRRRRRRFRPTAAGSACWPVTTCGPPPTWACRSWGSPSCTARAISPSASTTRVTRLSDPSVGCPTSCSNGSPQRVTVTLDDRAVVVAAWRAVIAGRTGAQVPVYFLDTGLADNDARDQGITDSLYGGDLAHRLRQEAVLGLAGPAMLADLGFADGATFHMNEGHSALLTVALLRAERSADAGPSDPGAVERVRRRCVFTTHTPVPAGHDRFDRPLVREVLGTGGLRRSRRPRVSGRRRAQHERAGDELLPVRQRGVAAPSNGVSEDVPSVRPDVDHQRCARRDVDCPQLQTDLRRPHPRVARRQRRPPRRGSIPLAEIDAAHRDAKHALVREVVPRAPARPSILMR